jgi:myo-inositol-1(or 4)-monophosphatase
VERCWVVDPIDGTHNFLRGVPYWNVSIGFSEGGRTRLGAVYDPAADELFHAREGHGAWCTSMIGDTPLHATTCTLLRGAYIVLGHHDRHPEPVYLRIRERMMAEGIAMRNFGAAALQLAHVASGRLDAFVEMELSAWDAVAGMLLVTEAGGRCAPFAPATPTAKGQCIASAAGIADALRALVKAAEKG